jgi:catalase
MGDFTTARVTTCAGSPIADNQKSAAAGPRGLAPMQGWRWVVVPAIKPDRLPSNT